MINVWKKVGETLGFREDYIFWRFAHYLVAVKQYRIVKIGESDEEIWLEKTESKNYPLIRLFRYDLDWGNWLQRDMERTIVRGERIRRHLRKGKLNLLNIYVSTYPPVDDYEYRIEKPLIIKNNRKTTMSTIIFENSNFAEATANLNEKLMADFALTFKSEYEESDVETVRQATLLEAKTRAKSESDIFRQGKPFFTYMFIAIQITVFLLMELAGGSTNISTLLKFGAKFNPYIIEGEWWRFFAPIVIHIGFFHLFMNTIALYYLGTAVERIFGNIRFLFIYLVAGFVGTLASFAFSPSISAGASGAIFGCFGALLYFGVIYPRLFFRTMGMNVLIVVGINLALGFTVPMIDNAGHLGGLVGGFLATSIVHFPQKSRLRLQLVSLTVTVLLTFSLLKYGYTNEQQFSQEESVVVLAQDAIENENYEDAYDWLSKYVEGTTDPSSEIIFTLAFTQLNLNKTAEAKENFELVIEMRDDFPEAHYYLALIYLETNNIQLAKDHAEKAIQLRPKDKNFRQFLDEFNDYLEEIGEEGISPH